MSVLQEWLEKVPPRMQSVLILGLRGPDTHAAPNIKAICRWLRGLALRPGNPDNVKQFMGPPPPRIEEKGPTAKELEFCTVHSYGHLMHALQVVALKYPTYEIAFYARCLYEDMVSLLHLEVESPADFERRLGERAWPGGQQPADYYQALRLIGGE